MKFATDFVSTLCMTEVLPTSAVLTQKHCIAQWAKLLADWVEIFRKINLLVAQQSADSSGTKTTDSESQGQRIKSCDGHEVQWPKNERS